MVSAIEDPPCSRAQPVTLAGRTSSRGASEQGFGAANERTRQRSRDNVEEEPLPGAGGRSPREHPLQRRAEMVEREGVDAAVPRADVPLVGESPGEAIVTSEPVAVPAQAP